MSDADTTGGNENESEESPLARGLRAAVDYDVPEDPVNHVPLSIAIADVRYQAAYFIVETDRDRSDVAKFLGLSPATVSSYLSRVRADAPDAEAGL